MTEALILFAVAIVLAVVFYASSRQRQDVERAVRRWGRAYKEAGHFRAKYGAGAPKVLQTRIAEETELRARAHLQRMARFIGRPK